MLYSMLRWLWLEIVHYIFSNNKKTDVHRHKARKMCHMFTRLEILITNTWLFCIPCIYQNITLYPLMYRISSKNKSCSNGFPLLLFSLFYTYHFWRTQRKTPSWNKRSTLSVTSAGLPRIGNLGNKIWFFLSSPFYGFLLQQQKKTY